MGKSKSKVIRVETESKRMSERRTNVNTLIQRLNSRSEPITPTELESPQDFFRPNKSQVNNNLREFVNSTQHVEESNMLTPDSGVDLSPDDFIICQATPYHSEMEMISFNNQKGETIGSPGKVIVKKTDSIDHIIDLIVNKSLKREVDLISEKDGIVRKCETQDIALKEKKRTAIRTIENKENSDWDDTIMDRLNSLENRAHIFEKRVDLMDKVIKGDTDFDRNMKNVLEENRRQKEDLEELKTIERTLSPTREGEAISAPKADPIIRNAIDRILDGREDESNFPYCWESARQSHGCK